MYHFLHLINILKDVFDHFPKISEDSQEVAPDFHGFLQPERRIRPNLQRIIFHLIVVQPVCNL